MRLNRNPAVVFLFGVFAAVCLLYYIQLNVVTLDEKCNQQPTPASRDIVQSMSMKRAFSTNKKTAVFEQPFNPMVMHVNKNNSFDYQAEMQKLNDAKVNQDDPRLIKLIREYYIIPPSTLPYNLKDERMLDYSMDQAPFVDSRLNYMEGGFYVECGALDGETRSNTLFFEKVRKWNGLLIEGDSSNVEKMMKKHRKAFIINACLNTQPYPSKRTFNNAFNMGRIADTDEANDWVKDHRLRQNKQEVQCFPLYSILLALDQLTVDYFSLDVEGDELGVLETIPWDKLNINMMSSEFVHGKDGSKGLKSYVENKGYDAMLQMSRFDGRANDILFRKKGYSRV